MDVVSGGQFALEPLVAGERANFFNASPASALECLSARFRRHVYAPHTHDSFVVGTIVAGCETFRIGGSRYYAGPGDLCLIDPGVVHDGEPVGEGYAYRISYPIPAFVADVTSDAVGREISWTPHFSTPIVRDRELAALFAHAHRLAETRGATLEADELFLEFFCRLLDRHGGAAAPMSAGVAGGTVHGDNGPLARVFEYLDAHFAEPVNLVTLAGIARLPRTRLIRAWKLATGLTPHAWLTDRRVRAARGLLCAGAAPAEVAAACGLYDQSHLNRVFKTRVGVSPGVFQAAHRSRPFDFAAARQ
jgi:AraC-like DNA-binding protein